jgi:hypothetical protein
MNEDKTERLSRFLDNDLSPEELKSFEQELQSDEALRSMLAMHLQLKAAGKAEQRQQIATMLDEALQTTPLRVQSFRPMLWKIAASLLFLVVAWWGIKTWTSKEDVLARAAGEKMYQAIMTRERAALTVAGDWNIEQMRAALQQKSDPCNYKDLCYFVGVDELFQQGDYAKAIELLRCTEAPANNGRHFREDVPFLLVIAYTASGQSESARQLVSQYGLDKSQFPVSIREKIEAR